jgi:hypothetical protein
MIILKVAFQNATQMFFANHCSVTISNQTQSDKLMGKTEDTTTGGAEVLNEVDYRRPLSPPAS